MRDIYNTKRFFTYIQDPPTLPQHYYKAPKNETYVMLWPAEDEEPLTLPTRELK